MADRIRGITIEIGGDTTGLNKALSGTNKEIRNTQDQLKDVERLLKLDPSNTELLRQKQKLLADAVGETKNKLDTLKEAERQAQDQFREGRISEEQYNALKREIIATEQQLERLEEQAGNANVALQKIGQAGESVKKFGGKAADAGKALLPVTGAIAAAGGASAKMAMDFEDAMAKVDTIADTTQVPLSDLEQSILDLSNQTGISSTEIADNVYDAISAGQETGDAVNFVANSTKLAKAGFADAGSALDILTTIMNAYGLEADEVNKVSDILIQTQNLGKTTVGELSTAMGKVIPTAKANGVALDQVATGYAIMTSNGIATAESTTYMNSMLNELGKSGTKVSDVIKKKTGKSFKELMDGGSSLADVLEIVSDSADEQGVAFGDLWGSAEAGKAALTLLGDGADGFNGTLDEMRNSTGATETAFGKMDTKSYELQRTINQLKNDAIAMGKAILDTLAPILGKISQKIQELHQWFGSLDEGQRETIVVVGLLVAALGPLLIIIGQMAAGVGALMTVVSSIGPLIGALGAAGGPIMLVVAALGLFAVAMHDAKERSQEYYDEAAALSEQEAANKTKVEELYGAYDQMNQRRSDAAVNAETEAQKEQALFGELQNITDENGNVKAGYEERAKYILGELSTALGQEYTLTGNQIKNYDDMCRSIDELILKKQANALMDANASAYAEALKNQTDAYMQYNEAQKNVAETEQSLGDAEKRRALLQEDLNALQEKSIAAKLGLSNESASLKAHIDAESEAISGYKDKLGGLNQTLSDADAAYVGYNTTIANYEGLSAAIISGDQQKIADAVLLTSNSFETSETATKESLERQVQTLTEKYQAMKAAVDTGAPGITQAQVDQMKELVDRSEQELSHLPDVVGDAANSSVQSLSGKSADYKAAGEQVGGDYSAGQAQGILAGQPDIENAAKTVSDAGTDASKDTLGIQSPSKVAHEIGTYFTEGLAEGITEGASQVTDAVGQVAGAAASALANQLQYSSTAAQTYQSSMGASWSAWASALAYTINTSLANIGLDVDAQMGAVESSFARETTAISTDWNIKWTAIKNKHKAIMKDIQDLMSTVLSAIKVLNQTETEIIKEDSITTMGQMVAGIDTELKKLEPTVRDGYEPAVKYIKDLIPQARIWANDMMDGYIQGIREKIRELEAACEDVADTVSDYIHFTRPEKGPLRDYEEWMPHMMQGLAKGIRDNRGLITEQMRGIAADMAASQVNGQQARQMVNLTSYNVIALDGKQVAETVNEQLGILL